MLSTFAGVTAFDTITTSHVGTGNNDVWTLFHMSGGDVTVPFLLVTQSTDVVTLWAFGFNVAFELITD